MTEPALIPWEAFDQTHPDHAEWVETTGRCLSTHDHDQWLADGQPTGEEGERVTEMTVPVRKQDGSNSKQVRLAIAAMLLGENASVERMKIEIYYRRPSGALRVFYFSDE